MACGLSPNFVGRRDKTKNVTSNFCRDSSHVRFSCTIFDFGHPGCDAMCFGIWILAFCRDIELAIFYPVKGGCMLFRDQKLHRRL